MIYPLKGKMVVTNPFGFKGGTKWYKFHTGVDFRAAIGKEVIAPEDGRIERVNSEAGGNGIRLYGKRAVHTFWHLSARQRNKQVKQGDRIGAAGSSGKWTTASHLHWETKVKGIVRNPLNLL